MLGGFCKAVGEEMGELGFGFPAIVAPARAIKGGSVPERALHPPLPRASSKGCFGIRGIPLVLYSM